MTEKRDRERGDRFGAPEGEGSRNLTYVDDDGTELSAGAWLEKVKEDADKVKKAKNKK